MNKTLVFDMDGTIADFYGVEGWLDDLKAEKTRPYAEAKPLYDMDELVEILKTLQLMGWEIAITTWLAKDATKAYNQAVTKVKKEWLTKYNFPYNEIHCVKYGTTKANCTRKKGGFQIIFDDNEKIRKGWTLGASVDAKNMMEFLKALT